MSTQNLVAIKSLYAAFAIGDMPNVLAVLHPDIIWNEAENFLYADNNPYIGPQAVLEGVFARCGSEWDGFAVEMNNIYDAGEHIIATGRYMGVYKQSGIAMNPQAVHIWTMLEGKAIRFQQHIDTYNVAKAIKVI
ncbi:nuclear transport factor 2 family protein [Thalassotalea piscium]